MFLNKKKSYFNLNKAFKNSIIISELQNDRNKLATKNGPNGSIPSSFFIETYTAYGNAKKDANIT